MRKNQLARPPEGLNVRGGPRSYRLHGASRVPEYRIWMAMRMRCTSPKHESYANYGGRGIRVCRRWLESFPAFLEDMGRRPSPRHTLDRIDNDGDYEPGNVRWVTRAENLRNRRNNVWLEVRGERLVLEDAAKKYGVHKNTLAYRIQHGWPVEEALGIKQRGR